VYRQSLPRLLYRPRLLLGIFSLPHRDELLTPPFASVSSLLAICFLPTAVIPVVCFFLSFFLVLVVSFFIFLFFSLLLDFSFYLFISLYGFIHVSACNKALSFLFDLPVSALVQTLDCGCEQFLGFRVNKDEFWHEYFALKAKE
jgi:hypothetical protein